MMHARVSHKYTNFVLMYKTDNIFPVLPINHLVNQYGEPTTPQKLENGTKPPVSNIRVLFYTCVARKENAHVDTKALSMRHHSQKGFWVILVGIPHIKKGNSSTYHVHIK